MKAIKLFVFLLMILPTSVGAQSIFGKDKTDKEHGGIGLEINRPNFGKYSGAESNWYGINILSDMFEARLLLGKIGMNSSEYAGFSNTKLPVPTTYGNSHHGANLSVGFSAPISSLGVGIEKNTLKTFRLHPFIGANLGAYSFWARNQFTTKQDYFAYLGFRPGVRARLPFVTVDFALNMELGLYSGNGNLKKPVRPFVISPSLVFRLNSQKAGLNLSSKRVGTTQTSFRETGRRTTSDVKYNGNVKTTTTTTHIKGVRTTSRGSMFVQDMGTFLAVGPVVAFSNPRRNDFQSASVLHGGNITLKSSALYLGLNVLAGKNGHGSTMKEPLTKKRTVDRKDTFGRGSYSAFNAFMDLGVDISPLAAALFGFSRDESNATPYFAMQVGLSLGVSKMGSQKFANPSSTVGINYDQLLIKNKEAKEYRIDPRQAGFGKMGGWWLGIDVGVVSFKMRSLTHKKSPFANNRFFELAYKVPLGKK